MTHPLVLCLRQALRENADAEIAAGQFAYMKEIQPFRGVKTPERRVLLKHCLSGHAPADFAEYRELILELWQGKYREERYSALDIAEKYRRFRTAQALPLFESMLPDADWWDVLDPLASNLLGGLLVNDAKTLHAKVRCWRKSPDLWTRRAALLVQLKHKEKTDTALLAESIEALAGETDFFICKAIGWVLREYSRTDPRWVRDFIRHHENRLSPLSKREALRLIQN